MYIYIYIYIYNDNNGQLRKVLLFYSTSVCKKERVLSSSLHAYILQKITHLLDVKCIHILKTSFSYTILYYTILYYSILYYTMLYYTILYYTMLYCAILYYTMQYYTILHYTIRGTLRTL